MQQAHNNGKGHVTTVVQEVSSWSCARCASCTQSTVSSGNRFGFPPGRLGIRDADVSDFRVVFGTVCGSLRSTIALSSWPQAFGPSLSPRIRKVAD